ncbi:peptidase domain-containing ABC transporter [Anaeromusa acidaminophila]|uniref:peptidase domain-containing ABC transporter n=1 Tax=Anaeromusa acidaminophila TaxID=81464 RepID=UPI0003710DBF|nr:ABC transporter transmembrane domain-containing protein [Anaeromusa acidaminophila]
MKETDQPVLNELWQSVCVVAQCFKVELAPYVGKMEALKAEENEEEFIGKFSKIAGIAFRRIEREYTFESLQSPCLLKQRNGSYITVLQKNDEKFLVWNSQQVEALQQLSREELLDSWSGEGWFLEKQFRLSQWLRSLRLRWIWQVLQRFRKYFYEMLVASFFLQLVALVVPLFTQVIIDKVIIHKGMITLNVLIVLAAVLAGFQFGMQYLRTYLLAHTTNRIDVILGSWLVRHLLSLPLAYHRSKRIGDTLLRISSLSSIREFLSSVAPFLGIDFLFGFVFLFVMWQYSSTLTLLVLAAAPIYIAQHYLLTPVYRKKTEAMWGISTESNAYLVEMINGIQTAKAMAIEPQFMKRWEQMTAKMAKASCENSVVAVASSSLGNLVQYCASFVLLWVGGKMVIANELTVGQLIAMQMISKQMYGPLFRLIGIWPTMQQTFMAAERLADLTRQAPEPRTGQGVKEERFSGDIVLKDVVFRYQPQLPPVLQGVSLQIKEGSCIGLVGRSGSGKSTIAKLLQRMYLPEAGSIQMGPMEVEAWEPLALRRQIGVVLQENYLFQGSIRDNIALSRPGASMDEVVRAAQIAGAHSFILSLADGYDTRVGERGGQLSGGQRQRIAIARSLLNNPKVLIFDEATSALDYPSEQAIMKNLDYIVQGRTVIMIAHRLHTLQKCDCIYVMDQGKIIESGTAEELMQNNGLYAHLYRLQYEGWQK